MSEHGSQSEHSEVNPAARNGPVHRYVRLLADVPWPATDAPLFLAWCAGGGYCAPILMLLVRAAVPMATYNRAQRALHPPNANTNPSSRGRKGLKRMALSDRTGRQCAKKAGVFGILWGCKDAEDI